MLPRVLLLSCVVVAADAFDWGTVFATDSPKGSSAGNCDHASCGNKKFCNKITNTCQRCNFCTGINGKGTSCGYCGTDPKKTWRESRYNNANIQSLSAKIVPASAQEKTIPATFICMLKSNSRRRLVSVEDGNGKRRLSNPDVTGLIQGLLAQANANLPSEVGAQAADEKMEVTDIRQNVNSMSAEMSPRALQYAAEDPSVLFCTQDAEVTGESLQIGPSSWGLDRVDQRDGTLDGLYETGKADGKGVNIYILDTGLDRSHRDFEGRRKGGYNAVQVSQSDADIDTDDWGDCNGHGTHCAGSAAGTIYGVAKKANIWGVRVLGKPPLNAPVRGTLTPSTDRCSKSGSWSSVLAGMSWVIEQCVSSNTPCIASMSIGGRKNQAINTAITNLKNAGITPVIAAGNAFSDACLDSPGSSPDGITVGASDSDNKLWRWHSNAGSNWGKCVDILAPGVSIKSALYGTEFGSGVQTGTSMATPHVAGGAALVASMFVEDTGRNPTYDEVRAALLARATKDKIDVSSAPSTPNVLLFTAYEKQNVDTDGDGKLSLEELQANFYDKTANKQAVERRKLLRVSASAEAASAAAAEQLQEGGR